eukprot:SAG31_NODE_640_length_13322_cov_4.396703_3_plen_66_part_00
MQAKDDPATWILLIEDLLKLAGEISPECRVRTISKLNSVRDGAISDLVDYSPCSLLSTLSFGLCL